MSEKINKYYEREIRWAERTLDQLSFFNNLLLTISVGFLSFTFKPKKIGNSFFNLTNIDWTLTLYHMSLILIVLSIFYGLKVAINRLLDFRITREIIKIRRHVYQYAESQLLDESTCDKFSIINRLLLPLKLMYDFPKITIEECKYYKDLKGQEKENFKSKFTKMRNIAHNLGINTWRLTYIQIIYFASSILFYFMAIN